MCDLQYSPVYTYMLGDTKGVIRMCKGKKYNRPKEKGQNDKQ